MYTTCRVGVLLSEISNTTAVQIAIITGSGSVLYTISTVYQWTDIHVEYV